MDNQDVEELFFSGNNNKFTYELVQKNVERMTNYDINKNKNFKQNFEKMAFSTFKNTDVSEKNLVNLNNSLIENSTKYFCNLIHKKQEKTQPIQQREKITINTNTYMPMEVRQSENFNSPINQQSSSQNILPFTLSDEFINEVENPSRPIYNNMNTLNQNDKRDPMKLMEEERTNREIEMNRFGEQMKHMKEKSLKPSLSNMNQTNNVQNNMSLGRDDVLINTRADNIQADPLELYRQNEETTNRVINSMTMNNVIDNKNPIQNSMLDAINDINKDYVTHNQPVYLEKDHFVSINSVDRDWENLTDSRYSFKVKFDSQDSDTGVNIPNMYKNVVSIELINVHIPHDSVIVPFDNRLYLDALQYPYLLLQIDEISGVFSGSNSSLEKSFSQLIFDKEHTSQVLSDGFIESDSEPTPDTRFQKQYQRGYYRFIPSFFEKKQYHNAPLSSLNSMTIRINNPHGDLFNTENDALEITSIAPEVIGNKEILATTAYPNTDCSGANNKYIKITTTKHFFNKQFKIGDKIRLSGVGSDDSSFDTFLNRKEGHYIVNLEKEDISANIVKNKSSIDTLYIAPQGTLNSTTHVLDTTTYNDGSDASFTSSGKLINMSLQTNLLFKIVTREVDVKEVTKPQNI